MVYGPPRSPSTAVSPPRTWSNAARWGVAEVGHGLAERAHRAVVTTHFGLGKDHTDVHVLQSARSGRFPAWGGGRSGRSDADAAG